LISPTETEIFTYDFLDRLSTDGGEVVAESPGDATRDGYVSMADCTYVQRVILGLSPATPGCDANQDGEITIADVTLIQIMIMYQGYYYDELGNLTYHNRVSYTYSAGSFSGLSGQWNLDEGSGAVASDSSGNGNYGTLVYSPAWVSGKKGQAVNFNGSDNYIVLNQQPPLTAGFTFSAWVKRSADQFGEIFNNIQFFLRVQPENENSSNPFEAFVKLSDGSVEPRVNSNIAAAPGQWYYVAVSWNGSQLKIYVNGQPAGTSTRSGTLTSTTVEADIGRGEQANPACNYWNGIIDQVKFYNRPLSDNEILDLYQDKHAGPHAVISAGAAGYAYDNNGNMTARGGQTITWDVENRPVNITGGNSYYYDGDGNRVKEIDAGSNTYVYINKYYEKNITASAVTTYYYLGSKLIAQRTAGTLKYIHQDSLGSTSVTSSAQGGSAESIRYLPYGLTRSGSVTPDKKFTGQRLDSTGLYYYNARYYDPQIGRFISPDTIVQDYTNPQCLNRYTYCLNNPLKYTDPSGHFLDWIFDALSIAFDISQVIMNPSWENAGYLAADLVLGIFPFVPAGVGPAAKAAKLARGASKVFKGIGTIRGISFASEAITKELQGFKLASQFGIESYNKLRILAAGI